MAKYTYNKKTKTYHSPSDNRMTPEMVLEILNGKWGRALKKIDVTEAGIVMVKRPKQQDQEDFTESLRQLADDVLIRLGVSTVLIGVENHGDIQYLDEEKMNWYGWIKKEKCFMLMEEADTFLADYTGEEDDNEEEE